MPKIVRQTAMIMAQDFTAEQLEAMLAFYRSPTGQAVLQQMPLITRQAMQTSNGLLPGFTEKFRADYCARVTCTDQDNQVFAQIAAHMAHAPAPVAPAAPGH